MNPERWQEIKDLFASAIEQDSGKRNAFLEEQAGDDSELLTEVRKLLALHSEAGDFLEEPVAERFEKQLVEPLNKGDQTGDFSIIRKIGQGGMGSVYLAKEIKTGRKVALKVIRSRYVGHQLKARFMGEQKALSLMSHPNIANIYGAGKTDRDLPFFAMEYVPGLPITTFCDHHKLRTKDKVGLIIQVLDGLEHTHEKGIIHRDLKPSNLLVTRLENEMRVKIIDFGILKASDNLTEDSLVTYSGMILGTLAYMSPEQAGLIDVPIGSYSDLYAVGILLYELLTGFSPFQAEQKVPFHVTLERIRDVVPSLPSEAIQPDGTTTNDPAHQELAKNLRGSLDYIVMKAINKNPEYRYKNCTEMKKDLALWTQGGAVSNDGIHPIGKTKRAGSRMLQAVRAIFKS